MGEDYFFGAPPGSNPPARPPADPVGPEAGSPSAGIAPGMPGYSWQQHQQVQAQVTAAAPPAVPLSGATLVAATAGLGSLLMLVGAWAPWVSISVFGTSEHVGGLRDGLNGRYVLALGFAALLTAATVAWSQANRQVRMVCAGVLLGLGLIGLGIVIHDWTSVSDRFREVNSLFDQFGDQLAAGATSGSNPFADIGFNGFEVSKAWGLTLSGIASAITGVAGAYLFATK